MTPIEKIETLRRLLEEATPGPWVVHPARAEVEAVSDQLPVCAMLWPTDERTEDQTLANASLIAEVHRALPALLDVAEAVAEMIEASYGPDGCDCKACQICDLQAALARLVAEAVEREEEEPSK